MWDKTLLCLMLLTPVTWVLAADSIIATSDGGRIFGSAQPLVTALAFAVALAGLIWWYRRERRSIEERRD